MPGIGKNWPSVQSVFHSNSPVILHDKVKSQMSRKRTNQLCAQKTYSEKFSEMAAVGEQQQDEDAAELTFPKVTYFGSHLVLT